jgi:polysaccharide deacetylase
MTARVPFAERGGAVRGVLDLVTGCYPAFLFGATVGEQLPVFHLHDVTRDWLEPRLQYLAENGYRTVWCDEIARFVIDGVRPAPKSIALTFDDAWSSAYTVAFPLLKQYGLRAILFAIPGRVGMAEFVTWPQLQELQESGIFDVQSHTRTHAMIFCDSQVIDFVTPEFANEPLLNRPLESDGLGTPLYLRRSRMSDARRFHPDESAAARCRTHVAIHDGADFFRRPNWRDELTEILGTVAGAFESDETRASRIQAELDEGRELLNSQLRTRTVKHVALPWGIAGSIARHAVQATGHQLAFAERPWRRRSVRAGDDRFGLMRLSSRFLTCLPGRGRQTFFTTVR